MSTFQALLLSLPAGHSTVRMRLWRTLKGTGCAVLRDGVYIVPSGSPQAGALAKVEAEAKAAGSRVRKLDAGKYRGRVWATRKEPWVDRLASAWLIKRFIDEGARFVWLEKPADCPKRAVGFDFDGAQFTHTGDRVGIREKARGDDARLRDAMRIFDFLYAGYAEREASATRLP